MQRARLIVCLTLSSFTGLPACGGDDTSAGSGTETETETETETDSNDGAEDSSETGDATSGSSSTSTESTESTSSGDTGDTGDGDGDGDGDAAGDGDGDGDGDGTCQVGSLGCACTLGGGCDPGLVCNVDVCEVDGNFEIRVVHASPDAPNVDVYVNDGATPVITDLGYGETTVYLDLPPGDYNFQIRGAGAPSTDPTVYETGALSLADGDRVTAVAAGLLTSTEPTEEFRVLPLFEGFADPGAGNAAVRVVHASGDAPTVDIDVGNDGSTEIDDLPRWGDPIPAGVPLPAATALQLGVELDDGTPFTAFTTPELPDGAELFVIATGRVGTVAREPDGFRLLAVGPAGTVGFIDQNPRVNAFHASPDAGVVDICAGGAVLFDDVDFGDIGEVQLPPGTYTLDFFLDPGLDCVGTADASFDTPALAGNQQYLVTASGEITPGPGDFPFGIQAFQEGFSLGETDSANRFVHVAGAGPVDVGVVDGFGEITVANTLAADLSNPNESAEVLIADGTYPVGLINAGTAPAASAITWSATLTGGSRYYVVVAGDAAGGIDEEPLSAFAIDTTSLPWTAGQLAEVP